MGGGRWSPSAYASYSTSVGIDTARSAKEIFRSNGMDPALDPKGVDIRESLDSEDNPLSTAVIVALDVTGSMGPTATAMAKEGLPALAKGLYDRRPVTDPHLMVMGVGDAAAGDQAPLQLTQFEADIRIAEQMTKLWMEHRGGGNHCESYTLPWFFANAHTKIDCFDKRGKKGFIFTMGDEEPPTELTADEIERVFGYRPQFDSISSEDLLEQVSKRYHVYHLMVEQGSYFRRCGDKVSDAWTGLLGQNAIPLSDHSKMGEVILSIMQIVAGEDKDSVVASWDGTTAIAVERATSALKTQEAGSDSEITLL